MEELTKRILIQMDAENEVNDIDFCNATKLYNLHGHGEVIYPSVYKHLGLLGNYDQRLINPGKHRECIYSFEEYVKAYIKMGKERGINR